MPSTSMWAYSWDLCHTSADDTIGRLKNEVGPSRECGHQLSYLRDALCPS